MAGGGSLIIKGGIASKGEVEVINGALKVTGISGGGGGVDNPMTADLDGGGFDIFNITNLNVGTSANTEPVQVTTGGIDALIIESDATVNFLETAAPSTVSGIFNVGERVNVVPTTIPVGGNAVNIAVGSRTNNVDGIRVEGTVASGALSFLCQNSSNGAGFDSATFICRVLGAVGDPYTQYDVNGGGTFAVGIDNSDSDKFKIVPSGHPSAATADFVIDSTGRVAVATNSPAASAQFSVISTDRGFLPPVMTNAQRDAIASPTNGLQAHTSDESSLEVSDGTDWLRVGPSDYGQIYTEGGAGSQTITTAGTYEKVTQFANNGESRNMTNDQANDQITIDNVGMYLVTVNMSYTGTNNSTITVRIRWNGVDQTQIEFQRKLGTGTDVGHSAATGIIDVTSASQNLEVFWTADSNGDALGVVNASLVVSRLA
jgi:hypothetical protein